MGYSAEMFITLVGYWMRYVCNFLSGESMWIITLIQWLSPARLGAIDYRLVDEMVDPSGAWDRWIERLDEKLRIHPRVRGSFSSNSRRCWYFTGGFKLFQIWLMLCSTFFNRTGMIPNDEHSICFRAPAVVHGEVGHDSALQWGTGESPGVRRSGRNPCDWKRWWKLKLCFPEWSKLRQNEDKMKICVFTCGTTNPGRILRWPFLLPKLQVLGFPGASCATRHPPGCRTLSATLRIPASNFGGLKRGFYPLVN